MEIIRKNAVKFCRKILPERCSAAGFSAGECGRVILRWWFRDIFRFFFSSAKDVFLGIYAILSVSFTNGLLCCLLDMIDYRTNISLSFSGVSGFKSLLCN
jgi:hypothetical protein